MKTHLTPTPRVATLAPLIAVAAAPLLSAQGAGGIR